MAAYIVLLLAALTRQRSAHALHSVGLNFTAVGGRLLFFGARRPRWQVAIAVAVMALTDVYLCTQVYLRSAVPTCTSYLVTWAWYAAVCLAGQRAPSQSLPCFASPRAILASATGFFLHQQLHGLDRARRSPTLPHRLLTLAPATSLALPFYHERPRVDRPLLWRTLFGLPVLAAKLVESFRSSHNQSLPLA